MIDDVRREDVDMDNSTENIQPQDDDDLGEPGEPENDPINDGADDENPLLHLAEDEDEPDPFHCPESLNSQERNLSDNAPHVLAIYAVASWLHLQFHLPRVACNALLTIFVLILMSICPTIETPFITLQLSNCVLGLDRPVHVLPVCPSCRDVFPPAGLPHCQDQCMLCNINLFLPSQTKCGNPQAIKTPIISYPYLPLSEQIKSLLKIPGLEAVLDTWRGKVRNPGEYIDIFDGTICRTRLKAPDGKLFFSNNENERHGPNGELWLGVNLGVDWSAYSTS
ncbi:hypothetical protein BDN67DRAFT_1016591 [Paxillus ammoniavirescens]|nr:hypothetical protein BDN67DRAFT_1016591 [Paxillus ammoniavirescens]